MLKNKVGASASHLAPMAAGSIHKLGLFCLRHHVIAATVEFCVYADSFCYPLLYFMDIY